MTFLKYVAFVFLLSCLARPTVKITDTKQHLHQNEQIEQSVLERAKTGDWLVIRGYHATDNLVTAATAIPISHVAVFNAENRMVIEAEGQGIHESTLKEFVNKSYRLLIIRPRWRNDSNSVEAFHNAQRLVGKKYDFLGTVGMNSAEKYYCSELAVDIYKKWHSKNEKFPTIIKPAELYLYGKILYDSLPRDEMKDGNG